MTRLSWSPWTPGSVAAMPGLEAVVGHRGAKAYAPENTLAGLREARRRGVTWVEVDAMLSADGIPVLIHDERLERTTNGVGDVAATSAADLARLDAGSWFGKAWAREPVPTLEAALDLARELGLSVNVEIKPATGHETATGVTVARMVRELEDGPPILLSSFSLDGLRAARDTAPEVPRGLLVEALPPDWADLMQEMGCTSLHPDQEPLQPDAVRALRAQGVAVLLYTVNDPARARAFLDAGASAIITDVPDVMLDVARSCGRA
ncbi:MAG: glycerophosphodiester phosphodiesterase [Geminicoccaceae bacterium]